MNRKNLINTIREKRSCLCIGLDTDIDKLPSHFSKSPQSVLDFNRQIIDATQDLCVAYKINTAFYEALGSEGWEVMEKTVNYISKNHLKIADAKRGDIGNTATQYAKAFFEKLSFDAITISPYMGTDCIIPFLHYKNKWVIILGLTSNPGSAEFQKQVCGDEPLWERVLKVTAKCSDENNVMYVVGATRGDDIAKVRSVAPRHFFLVPGVGAQGGKISEVMSLGKNDDVGLLINVSRSVIFAGNEKDFASRARDAAMNFRNEMKEYI